MSNVETLRTFREKHKIYTYPIILAIIMTTLVKPLPISSSVMEPTLENGQMIIIVKHRYSSVRGAPDFAQIVAFRTDFLKEEDKGKTRISRVIGLPGDKIEIKDGKVFRNDELLEETYATARTEGNVKPIVLGKEEVFVLGDNRQGSVDSRDPRVGPLNMALIAGSCEVTIWPINQIGRIR